MRSGKYNFPFRCVPKCNFGTREKSVTTDGHGCDGFAPCAIRVHRCPSMVEAFIAKRSGGLWPHRKPRDRPVDLCPTSRRRHSPLRLPSCVRLCRVGFARERWGKPTYWDLKPSRRGWGMGLSCWGATRCVFEAFWHGACPLCIRHGDRRMDEARGQALGIDCLARTRHTLGHSMGRGDTGRHHAREENHAVQRTIQ